MKDVAHRNEQFERIAELVETFSAAGNPVFSLDTKKKEYLGNFYRDGHLYSTQTIHSYDHDFNSFASGVVIPHTIYDIQHNKAFINLGTSKETSQFACESFEHTWTHHAQFDFPDASAILILCDGGGSNNARHFIFKQDLQNLANTLNIPIRIAHYPPYCSKYNPVEHRVFPHVTRACQGVIFNTIDTVQHLMAQTKTAQGLSVIVNVFDKIYQTGRKVAQDFRENMPIRFDDFLPLWNYSALPSSS